MNPITDEVLRDLDAMERAEDRRLERAHRRAIDAGHGSAKPGHQQRHAATIDAAMEQPK